MFRRLPDSGGLFARYGPLTAEEERADGTRVRVHFERPISRRRAHRFARAVADGEPVPPNARVTVTEHPPAYKIDPYAEVRWTPASQMGTNHTGTNDPCLVKFGDTVTWGTYRETWRWEWKWFDPKGRVIKPELYAYVPPR